MIDPVSKVIASKLRQEPSIVFCLSCKEEVGLKVKDTTFSQLGKGVRQVQDHFVCQGCGAPFVWYWLEIENGKRYPKQGS